MTCCEQLHNSDCLEERKGQERERKTATPLYLFQLEDVLVEIVLQPFVGEVDAELFKAVILIILKAEDVQDPYRQDLGGGRQIVFTVSTEQMNINNPFATLQTLIHLLFFWLPIYSLSVPVTPWLSLRFMSSDVINMHHLRRRSLKEDL